MDRLMDNRSINRLRAKFLRLCNSVKIIKAKEGEGVAREIWNAISDKTRTRILLLTIAERRKRVRILFHEIRESFAIVSFGFSCSSITYVDTRFKAEKNSLSLSLSFIAIRRGSRRSFVDRRGEPSEINVATEGSRTVGRKPASLSGRIVSKGIGR